MKQPLPVVSQTTHENLLPNRFHFAVQQIPLRRAADFFLLGSRFSSGGLQMEEAYESMEANSE
ncbi:MAG: hypothetical protein IJ417_04690 [Bacteroidaceae bacterium]|nr:hypothetical protein [Bacteroidaceae bacterium]